MTRVLVVDDETAIRELVGMGLRYGGHEVAEAGTGREALESFRRDRPDLVVLDVMLPDLDGFETARRLRALDRSDLPTPVIFLTARDATGDKVEGLRLGGDDYVTKPFSVEELLARVDAVLRRVRPASGDRPVLGFADLTLDEASREVLRGGRRVELTATEYRLLHYLLLNARRVVTRQQILEAVWDYTFAGNASVLETYVSYLRHKLDDGEEPLIHTVRGVGYCLREARR
jgi:two-component system OmpR family response regulator